MRTLGDKITRTIARRNSQKYALLRVTAETRKKMSSLIGERFYNKGVRTLGGLVDALVDAETRRKDD